jgi:hypothetical protein
MRFGDIYDQEGDAISVLLIKLVEGGSLPPEGRSSVTSKHQHDRLSLV